MVVAQVVASAATAGTAPPDPSRSLEPYLPVAEPRAAVKAIVKMHTTDAVVCTGTGGRRYMNVDVDVDVDMRSDAVVRRESNAEGAFSWREKRGA